MTGQIIHYSGEDYLINILTYNNIVKENDKGLTVILEDTLSKWQDISFMIIDVEKSTEFINDQI